MCHVVCVQVWGACVQRNTLGRRQSVDHGRALCQSTTMSVYPAWGVKEGNNIIKDGVAKKSSHSETLAFSKHELQQC